MEKLSFPRIGIVVLTIIVVLSFFGYSYYADADALSKVHATMGYVNSVSSKITSADITFTLNLSNPSHRDINDLSSDFDIYIQSNYIGEGSFSGLSIPAQSTVSKPVSITVYYTGLADSVVDIIRNWIKGQTTPITVEGTMRASVLFGLAEGSHEYTAVLN